MIIVRLKGGLGNQMFQYALGRILSIKNKTDLAFNIEAYLDTTARPFKGERMALREMQIDAFNIVGHIAERHEIPWQYRMYGKGPLALIFDAVRRRILRHKVLEIDVAPFNPKMLELGGNSYMDGFFQSPKYFSGFEDVLRKDFTPQNPLGEKILNLINEIRSINSVCLFVRRTDFVGNKAHEVVGNDFYDKAVQYLSTRTMIEKIYVFSDDIEWCEKNLSFLYPTMFVTNEYAGEKYTGKLLCMSACKHFIIPNSSFAWWAAWLNTDPDKIVVVPKEWFPKSAGIDYKDIVPDEWVRM